MSGNEIFKLLKKYARSRLPDFDAMSEHPLESLNLSAIERYSQKDALADILNAVNPKSIRRVFGLPVLLWTWAQNVDSDYDSYRTGELSRELEKATGVNTTLLREIYLKRCNRLNDLKVINAFVEYGLVQDFNRKRKPSADIEKLVDKYTKTGFSIKDRYELGAINSKGMDKTYECGYEAEFGNKHFTEKGIKFDVYLDAPLGIGLYNPNSKIMKGKMPIAVTSFKLINPNTFYIKQIQGVMPRTITGSELISVRELMPIEWEKILIEAVIQTAIDFKADEIVVQGAEKNKYYHIRNITAEEDGDENNQRLKRRYNKPAQEMGFECDQLNDWHLDLNEWNQ